MKRFGITTFLALLVVVLVVVLVESAPRVEAQIVPTTHPCPNPVPANGCQLIGRTHTSPSGQRTTTYECSGSCTSPSSCIPGYFTDAGGVEMKYCYCSGGFGGPPVGKCQMTVETECGCADCQAFAPDNPCSGDKPICRVLQCNQGGDLLFWCACAAPGQFYP